MTTGTKVFSTTISFCIVCISVILAAIVELQENIPWLIVVVLPIVGGLAVYILFLFIDTDKKVRRFFASFKGIISLLFLLVFFVLCSTPVNEFTSYLSKATKPFRQYRWLSASLVGTLFALSFLNYALLHPESRLLKVARLCKAIWHLRATYFLLIFSLWMFVAANFISWKVFDHIPHVSDEIAQLFQAKIFAQGMLTAPLPPIIDFFCYHYDNMIFTTRCYSQYPPGHPFFLMLGLVAKVPWLINPLFASLSVILLYKSAFLYYGEKEAKLSVILFCVSPFVLFMSASFMSHVSALFFLLLFVYTLNKAIVRRRNFYALFSGLSLGVLFNIRTGDAVAIGVIFCAILFILSSFTKTYRPFVVFVASIFFMIALLLTYNYATNGDPLLFGYQVRWGKEHTIGFSNRSIMDSPPHTPLRGVIHTLSNGIALNQDLFEWPFPSLVPLFVFWMPFIIKKTKKDYLILCGLLAAPVFCFFYYYQDLCLGPRLYYSSLPFLIILTAKAFFHITEGVAHLRRCPETYVKNAFIALLFISVIFAGVFRIPKLYRFYSDSFWYVDNKLMKKVQELGINNALIFQKSYGYKGNALGSGFLYNSPSLQDPVVFARDLGERNAELVPFFPGRNYYLASRDGRGEVIIEPLNAAEKKRK